MREDKILRKLNQIDRKFDKIDQKFDKIDSRFDRIDGIFQAHGKVLQELQSHNEFVDEQLEFIRETAVTNLEFQQFRGEYLQGQDQVVTFLKRLDEERLVTHARLGLLESWRELQEKNSPPLFSATL